MKRFSIVFILLIGITGASFGQIQDTPPISDEDKARAVERILEEKLRLPEGVEFSEYEWSEAAKTAGVGETKVSNLTDAAVSEAEPFIAINPTDSNNIVISYMENGAAGLEFPIFVTTDGGLSWTSSSFDALGVVVADFPGLTVGGGGDPVFAFDATGKLYYSWLYLLIDFINLDGKMAMYWASSTDGGASFSVVQDSNRFVGYGNLAFLSQPGAEGDGIHDRQWMAVDQSGGQYNGNLYFTMLYVPGTNPGINGSGMVVKTKQAQYDSLNRVNAVVEASTEVQFGNVAVDRNGNVHVTYGDLQSKTIKHSISVNGGTSFSTPQVIAVANNLIGTQGSNGNVHNRENAAPNLAVDQTSDNMYVSWTDLESSTTQAYLAYSNNSGTTWSLPIDLKTLVGDPAVTQGLMPSTAVDQNGNASVTFWGLDANDEGHFYASESKDGGQTWEPARIVTSVTTDFGSYSGSQAFFGDYQTAVKWGCNTYSVWADGRNAAGPKMYFGCTDHCATVGISDLSPLTDELTVGLPFPNPGQEKLEIELELKHSNAFQIALLDPTGRMIQDLDQSAEGTQLPAGKHHLKWDINSDVAAGWYLLELNSPAGRVVRKWYKSK